MVKAQPDAMPWCARPAASRIDLDIYPVGKQSPPVAPIIFLDIDGVMIAYPDGGSTSPVFTPRCAAAFRMILTAVPSAKVVFSTTWRLSGYVNRLHEQWLVHGFPRSLAIDGTPDLRQDPSVRRRHARGIEIQRWLEANPGMTRWVVLDDERMAIEEVLDNSRCVFTDPARGLTADDAKAAIEILAWATVGKMGASDRPSPPTSSVDLPSPF